MEPVTLATVGGTILVEGVKFLYAQASDLIRYWRERRAAKPDENDAEADRVTPGRPAGRRT